MSIVSKNLSDISPTFCPMPFNHSFIGPDWVKKPCSRFLFPEIDYENYNEFIKDLQQYKLRGERHPGCRKCWEEEDAGRNRSLRQIHCQVEGFNYPMTYDLDVNDPKIRWLELSFSNRCNVRCRMCGPFYSTNWYKDWLTVPEYAFGVPGVGKDPEKIEAWLNKNGNKPQPFDISELDEHIPHLRMVKMTGGEPFIIPEYQQILERIDEIGNAEGMWLNYSTNLTVRPKKRLKELWEKYEKIMFATSLDGIGHFIEYQRYPTQWCDVKLVMDDLMEIPNSWVGVRSTITIYNVLNMTGIANWFAEQEDKYHGFSEDSWLNFVAASTPEFLSITVLPKWAKDMVAERISWSAPSRKIQDNFDQIINYMYNEDNSHLLPKFKDYTLKLDAARGEDFREVVPEFASLL